LPFSVCKIFPAKKETHKASTVIFAQMVVKIETEVGRQIRSSGTKAKPIDKFYIVYKPTCSEFNVAFLEIIIKRTLLFPTITSVKIMATAIKKVRTIIIIYTDVFCLALYKGCG
jgi:hypothetical protein